MKLKIRRGQADVKGLFGGHKGVSFSLFAQAELSPDEKALIAKYKVGEYTLAEYKIKDLDLSITVDGLTNGRTVSLGVGSLLEFEETLKASCVSLKNLLRVMATFGGEEVIEI